MKPAALATACLFLLLPPALAAGQDAPPRRIVFNDDAQVLFETPRDGAVSFVTDWLDRQIDAIPFTTFVFQAAITEVCVYETKVGDVYADRLPDWDGGAAPGIRALRAAGTDSLRVVTQHMQRRGKDVLAAVRMGDTHHASVDAANPLCSKFLLDHPEYIIRQPDGRQNETALDYSHAEVRAKRLAIMREIAEEYDVDGLELNFVRWAKHFPRDKGFEKALIMTNFMGEVHAMLATAARKRGRDRLTLGVRVPESINTCWLAGVDIETWVKNGWLDYVVVCTYNNTDPRVPVEQFARFTRPAGVDTLVAMGNLMSGAAAGPTVLDRDIGQYAQRPADYRGMALLEAEARAAAANYYAWGATGVSFWNVGVHFGERLGDPRHMDRMRAWSQAVQSPEAAWSGPREYHFLPLGKGWAARKPPVRNYPWAIENHSIIGEPKGPVIWFTNHLRRVFPFRMADGRRGEKLAGTLRFWVYHLEESQQLDVDVNGTAIESSRVRRVPAGERRGGVPGYRFEISLADCPPLRGDNDLGLTLRNPTAERPAPLMEELVVTVTDNSLPDDKQTLAWQSPKQSQPVKILIAVDSEGQTGNNEYWARHRRPGDPEFERYRGLLTDDVNAVITGCYAGGADEVYVKDDGFGGRSLIRDQLDKRATVLPNGGPILNGLDRTFAGVMLVGFHAMEGAKDGVLAHTWSSTRRRRYWFNEREGGEVFVYATVAGHDHHLPIIMATGCQGLCREVNELLGDQVVTVSVKSVTADGRVALPPASDTLPRITAGAKQAIQNLATMKPFRPTFPITIRLELADEATVDGYIKWRNDNKSDWPGVKDTKTSIEAIVTSTRHFTL